VQKKESLDWLHFIIFIYRINRLVCDAFILDLSIIWLVFMSTKFVLYQFKRFNSAVLERFLFSQPFFVISLLLESQGLGIIYIFFSWLKLSFTSCHAIWDDFFHFLSFIFCSPLYFQMIDTVFILHKTIQCYPSHTESQMIWVWRGNYIN
jgi:hypothetical protein